MTSSATCTLTSSPTYNTLNSATPEVLQHKRISAFGRRLSILKSDGVEYIIGVQVAGLLKRETFNMYRSMKIKNILLQRATPEQVEFLCQHNAVRAGTHSVTLIPYESGMYFVADVFYRQQNAEENVFLLDKKKQKSFITTQPKLHRRKPLPWDVRRSLKKDELPYLMSSKNLTLDLDIKINPPRTVLPKPFSPMESLLAAANSDQETSSGSNDSNSSITSFKLGTFPPRSTTIHQCNQISKGKSLQSLCSKFSIAC